MEGGDEDKVGRRQESHLTLIGRVLSGDPVFPGEAKSGEWEEICQDKVTVGDDQPGNWPSSPRNIQLLLTDDKRQRKRSMGVTSR